MTTKSSFQALATLVGLGMLLGLPLAAQAEVATGLSDGLQQALEAQGWRAERLQDGSVIYRQPTAAVPTQQAEPSTRTLQGQALEKQLNARGWQMERGPQGSLILRPQTPSRPVTQTPEPRVKKTADPLSDLPGFEYWRIERQADGSLRFYPLGEAAGTSRPASSQVTQDRCEGVEVEAPISLPVDQWGEARSLAHSWLQQSGRQDLLVGKIRRVMGIYLISLVSETPPYFLRHQLAIRASDGRVMLLE
jgi:hypothetical protein